MDFFFNSIIQALSESTIWRTTAENDKKKNEKGICFPRTASTDHSSDFLRE